MYVCIFLLLQVIGSDTDRNSSFDVFPSLVTEWVGRRCRDHSSDQRTPLMSDSDVLPENTVVLPLDECTERTVMMEQVQEVPVIS